MIESTKFGLTLDSRALRTFNQGFIDQIRPHLDGLRLRHAVLKFTGDGWLVMSQEPNDVIPLACLAQAMVETFQRDMHERTGLDEVPGLRVSICVGHDERVTLPNGSIDLVGDSARRACRLNRLCRPNEVLLCSASQVGVMRDFEVDRVKDVEREQRLADREGGKWEEDFVFFRLVGPKDHLTRDSDPALVYLLAVLGRIEQASELYDEMAGSPEWRGAVHALGLERYVAALPNLETAKSLLDKANQHGVKPTVNAFNALLGKARDWAKVLEIADEMEQADVRPDQSTYLRMIEIAPDWPATRQVVSAMQKESFVPDRSTYHAILERAPDWSSACAVADQMKAAGVEPDAETYRLLLRRAPKGERTRLLDALERS